MWSGIHSATVACRIWEQGSKHAEAQIVNPHFQEELGMCEICTTHDKGDAPLKTTGHSQPAPEKREAQATEVLLEYYLERNCHACYVTVQWK